jgi:hypothetical protein
MVENASRFARELSVQELSIPLRDKQQVPLLTESVSCLGRFSLIADKKWMALLTPQLTWRARNEDGAEPHRPSSMLWAAATRNYIRMRWKQEGPQPAAGLHQRSVQLNLVRPGSIVVAIHLLPEGLHIPVLCTSGGHNGGNKRQGKKC